MKTKLFIGIIIVVAVAAGIGLVKALQIKTLIESAKHMPLQTETVASAQAVEETWQDTLQAIGSVSAAQGVLVSPEVAGMVSELDFDSGARVKKGDLLIRLDTTSEEAQLRAAQAQVELAKLNADRSQQLIEQDDFADGAGHEPGDVETKPGERGRDLGDHR